MPRLIYAAAGANRASSIADSGIVVVSAAHVDLSNPSVTRASDQLIVPLFAYAAHKSVVCWERPSSPDAPEISSVVRAAESPITALRFIHSSTKVKGIQAASVVTALAVGTADGSVCIFEPYAAAEASPNLHRNARLAWRRIAEFKKLHTGSISALGTVKASPGDPAQALLDRSRGVLVSGGSDGKLVVMSSFRSTEQSQSLQIIDLKGPLPLALSLTQLPGTDRLAMAAGITKAKVLLFVQAKNTQTFQKVAELDGHEDWIRELDFCTTLPRRAEQNPELVLATASQDACIRLWRIKEPTSDSSEKIRSSKADAFEALAEKLQEDKADDRGVSTRAHPFTVEGINGKEKSFSAAFDALLIGHDGWVNDLRWEPPNRHGQPASLISAGTDGSAILWTPSSGRIASDQAAVFALQSRGRKTFAHPDAASDSALWMPTARFGEVGGVATGGFYGCAWLPQDGEKDQTTSIITHAWNGASHVFRKSAPDASWAAAPSIGGHLGSVNGIDWEPTGKHFLSCGADRTTRLHGAYIRTVGRAHQTKASWHELARPQTHGYDLLSVAWLNRDSFASAADEKIVRVFSATDGFSQTSEALGAESALSSAAFGGNMALVISLGSLEEVTNPHAYELAVKKAAEKLQSKQRLQIIFVSPVWDPFCETEATPVSSLSFGQIESFLKWAYSQAWGIAVGRDLLDADIDVLLLPGKHQDQLHRVVSSDRIGVQEIIGIEGELLRPPQCKAHLNFDLLIGQQLVHSLNGLAKVSVLPKGTNAKDVNLTTQDKTAFPRYPALALGGTFDHLHVGHKILLSIAALMCCKRIIVGLTSETIQKEI